ncbi:MAG: hypothetical protein KAI53_00070 [Candidatus Aenigmarchaeota archaeon]|nr:hypothetical protein [Candidatus Aenigmarchaeota archaeon]
MKDAKGELAVNTMILMALGILVLALIVILILQWKGDMISLVSGVLKPPATP